MEHKLIAYYEQKLDASEIAEVEQWLLSDAMHQKYKRIRSVSGRMPNKRKNLHS